MKGIDLSTFQRNVNYRKLKEQGIEFAILRCGYGKELSQKDELFETHYKGCKEVGIKVGAYLYSYCTSIKNSTLEANNCLSFIKDKTFELPIFYDLEERITKVLGKDKITKIALNFCDIIKKAGFRAGVYANLDWFRNYIDVEQIIQNNNLIWLAQWNSDFTNDLKINYWQYTNQGQVNGINGHVDLDMLIDDNLENSTEIINKKSIEQLANEVIEGKWGVQPERQQRLEAEGYNYNEVQNLVNQKMSQNKGLYHTVKKGDTLSQLALTYGTSIQAIAKLNNIVDVNKIYVNQRLKIK